MKIVNIRGTPSLEDFKVAASALPKDKMRILRNN
jgi:hypothetical protein